jgi:hypothetical protein
MFGALEPTRMQQYYQIRVTGTDLQGLRLQSNKF